METNGCYNGSISKGRNFFDARVMTATIYMFPKPGHQIYGYSIKRSLGERKVNHCEKKTCIIEDKPEALEATNEAALTQNIKDDNLEGNMEVAMEVGEIDEDDTKVVE